MMRTSEYAHMHDAMSPPQEWASAVPIFLGKYASMQVAVSPRRSGLAQCVFLGGKCASVRDAP